MRCVSIALIAAAMAGSASADDIIGTRISHPVMKKVTEQVTLDCIVREDLGLKDCVIVAATPVAREKAADIIKMFETRVHVPAADKGVGHHRQLKYSWREDA